MNKEQKNLIFEKANSYAHAVYNLCKKLPKDELYGITSQLGRASLSVPANMIEGYARMSKGYHKQFLLNSYGSLKESQYFLQFAAEESLLEHDAVKTVYIIGDEVGAMLWSRIKTLEKT